MADNPSIERITKSTAALDELRTLMQTSGKPPFLIADDQLGDRRVLRQGEALHATTRRAADAMDLLKGIFTHIGFSGTQLRTLEEAVRVDGTIRDQVNGTAGEVNGQYSGNYELMARATTLVVDTIRAVKDNPCTPPDLLKQIELHGQPVLDLVERYNQGVQSTKNSNKALRDAAAEDLKLARSAVDAATLTTKVLRGQDVPADQVTPSARRLNR